MLSVIASLQADDKSGRACVILTLNAILLLQTFGSTFPSA
jgi:hypothetical protein